MVELFLLVLVWFLNIPLALQVIGTVFMAIGFAIDVANLILKIVTKKFED